MRSMIPSPSRRAASRTSESRRPVRAARTRTCRISLSSMDRVVFTFAIRIAYCHIYGKTAMGWLNGHRSPCRQADLGTALKPIEWAKRRESTALSSRSRCNTCPDKEALHVAWKRSDPNGSPLRLRNRPCDQLRLR
jgi:hypothetical protein